MNTCHSVNYTWVGKMVPKYILENQLYMMIIIILISCIQMKFRLRNMNYSMTIHYDIEVEFIDKLMPGQAPTIIGGGEIPGVITEEIKEGNKTIVEAVADDQKIEEDQNKQNNVKPEFQSGGGPKSTKIKKRKTEDVRLEITTKTAAQLRELAESTVSENTQTRTHMLEKIFWTFSNYGSI